MTIEQMMRVKTTLLFTGGFKYRTFHTDNNVKIHREPDVEDYLLILQNPQLGIAPLPKTCADFWYMVVQEKSTAILMLCNFIEQNSKKSAQYLPLTPEESPLTFNGVVVKFKKQEQASNFQFPMSTKVNVRITHLEVRVPGENPHITSHYHWMDWPDRGVPEADLASVCILSKIRNTTAPIIVHCSAGIGRTGSIVLIEHALEILQTHEPLGEIRQMLLALRKQRNNSIQRSTDLTFTAPYGGGIDIRYPRTAFIMVGMAEWISRVIVVYGLETLHLLGTSRSPTPDFLP
ncbi:unnamed protein product [Nippostrongylus brasiliensis]|uniref:Protein-tyrosine phosphatase n=1 Tax=Nippostrongylus brasiliensis TaxID=27835 RepID=A0A0N4YZ94_NIPBR|nr:unnamed protein product [Nippostrongylus brasiliensis]